MSLPGLILCTRYSYPPNSLFLCGPDRQEDLKWYSTHQQGDKGTIEILSCFSTLYPYLTLIAHENDIADPFDKKVVEAYWLGNNLLHQIPITRFVRHLSDNLQLRKKVGRKKLEFIFTKIEQEALPHHSFHVLNIYKRTGHLEIPYILETMDACLIKWGKIKKILTDSIVVETKPLRLIHHKLDFGTPELRTLLFQGKKDILARKLLLGDWVSSHWGYFCQKLTARQVRNSIYYTNISLNFANK